ncbi:hypothetical protein FSARC_1932 [Fusarium sarcochroum]|uniref:Tachykinin family protein n=1 Tax=Fusarium sarcochroum TaxID=1208366 RepID=A0A8H4XEA8_9HYPO|nr:hypothetical protein FSARC_1932 [Fusarium sarcochroum]
MSASSAKLEFVSISHPDEIKSRRNKRKVHQHVMKPIGLSRRKKTPNRNTRSGPSASTTSAAHHDGVPVLDQHADVFQKPSMQALIPAADTILYYGTDTRAKRMEAFLLRPNSSLCGKVREICFAIGLINDAAFHLALAESSLYEYGQVEYLHPGSENSMALKHYNLCLQFTNRKIQAVGNQMCDGVLITVIGLASYDMSIGKLERYSTHLAGLETLVRSRGGVEKLQSSYLVMSLIWSDVIGCLSLDRPSRFTPPSYLWKPLEPLTIKISPMLSEITYTLINRLPQLSETCSVLESLASVAKASQHGQDPNYNYCLTIVHSSYFLLLMPRAESLDAPEMISGEAIIIHEAIRLAALRFLVTAAEYTHHTTGASHSRKPQLSDLLEKYGHSWIGFAELQLWILLVAAVTEEGQNMAWLTGQISLMLEELSLNWSGVRHVLSQIAWVDDAFEAQLGQIEEAVHHYNCSKEA